MFVGVEPVTVVPEAGSLFTARLITAVKSRFVDPSVPSETL